MGSGLRVAALTVVVVVVLAACSSSSKQAATPTSSGGQSTVATSGGGQATVTAADTRQFTPVTLTITVGQTVTWTNAGTIDHTVTFDTGPAFDKPLAAGSTVTRTLSTAGTFTYHCTIHGPSMHGTIIVK
jgi:plastocyanin